MPGAGKSTLGKQLAAALDLRFIDTDALIEQHVGMRLQEYLNRYGYQALRNEEEKQLLKADFTGAVVATGGSAVYSKTGMQRLCALGPCVYLKVNYSTMVGRIDNASSRGLAVAKGTGLKTLYLERLPLYERWATQTVACDQADTKAILQTLIASLGSGKS